MNIGQYSFAEFRVLAEQFHGFAAPGLLIGGYMVELAKRQLPSGTLFEAVVESGKCLPDAVQMLTLCSLGNGRLKVFELGRFGVALFDKNTGEGIRVAIDAEKLRKWPEIYAWYFKEKPKHEQDVARLDKEIEEAGDSYCKIEKITIKDQFIGHHHKKSVRCCPSCGEPFPGEDGDLCRYCQGESPYKLLAPMNQ